MHNKPNTGKSKPGHIIAKLDAIITRVQSRLKRCDSSSEARNLPWLADTKRRQGVLDRGLNLQPRAAIAQRLIKEIPAYRASCMKLTPERRTDLFAQLRVLPFDAQCRKLRGLSGSTHSVTQVSDDLFFRWGSHSPREFAEWVLKAVPDFSKFARRLPEKGREILLAKLQTVNSTTVQSLALIAATGSRRTVSFVAEKYEWQFKPAHEIARRELKKKGRGDQILRRYCKNQAQATCHHFSTIVTELVDLPSGKPLREILLRQHGANPSRLRQFLNDALCIIAYSPKNTAVEDLALAVLQLAADRAPKDRKAKADFAAIARSLRTNPVLLEPMLREIRKSPVRLLDFLAELLTHWQKSFSDGSGFREDMALASGWPEFEHLADKDILVPLGRMTGKTYLPVASEVLRIKQRRKRLHITRR